MTYTVVTTAAQGSDEWLDARRNGIGGSDVAAVLGANPWRTPLEVWLSKTGQGETFTGSEKADWGHRLEPVVRDHYASLHPHWWVDEVPGVLAHPDVPIAMASLDGLVNAKEGQHGLEVKTTGQSWDRPPDMYLFQVAWYQAVTGLPRFDFAVLARGQQYSEYTVERDDRLCEDLLTFVPEWWERHVVGGEMPDPDLVRDRHLLPRLWTADEKREPVVLDSALADRLRDAKAAMNATRTDFEIVAAEVQSAMQESTVAVDSGGTKVATWVGTKARRSVDTARMKEAGIYDEYTMLGQPGRQFRVAT